MHEVIDQHSETESDTDYNRKGRRNRGESMHQSLLWAPRRTVLLVPAPECPVDGTCRHRQPVSPCYTPPMAPSPTELPPKSIAYPHTSFCLCIGPDIQKQLHDPLTAIPGGRLERIFLVLRCTVEGEMSCTCGIVQCKGTCSGMSKDGKEGAGTHTGTKGRS